MGFRNPFRITLDKNDVAYVTDYSPDSQVPQQFRGPPGTGRVEIVREPANYGWPLCYKTDLPYYQWDFNTSTPLPSAAAPEPHECDNPTRGPQNTSRWVASGGPTVEPGLEYGAADHEPGDLVLVPRQPGAAERPAGHAVLRELRAGRAGQPGRRCARSSSPSSSPAASARTAPRRTTTTRPTRTRRSSRRTTTAPFILGEFTQDTLREVRLDSHEPRPQDQQHACPAARSRRRRPGRGCATTRWTWSSGPTARFYLLTYGDGFFAINPDAGMMRWEYVKGLRAPVAVADGHPDQRARCR